MPVPRGCHPEMGYTPGGTPAGFDVADVRTTRFTEITANRNARTRPLLAGLSMQYGSLSIKIIAA
jgi:hypothetical protein